MAFRNKAFRELADQTGLTFKNGRVTGEFRGRTVQISPVSYGCLLWIMAVILGTVTGGDVYWTNKIEILITLIKPTRRGFRLRRAPGMRLRNAAESNIPFERQFRVNGQSTDLLKEALGHKLSKQLQDLDGALLTIPGIDLRVKDNYLRLQRQEFRPMDKSYSAYLFTTLALLIGIAEAVESA